MSSAAPPDPADPPSDLLVAIDQAVAGLTGDDRGRAVRDHAARHPQFRAAILDLFTLAAALGAAPPPPPPPSPSGVPAPPPPPRFRPGDVLGRYQIVRFVARGGMGEVYEAWEELLGRVVALKVLRPGPTEPAAAARFDQEARVQAEVHHANVVPVYHTGEHGGLRYTVMQFVGGVSLHAVLGELARTGGTPGGGSASLRGAASDLLRTRAIDAPPPAARPPAAPVRPKPAYYRSLAAALAQAGDGLHHTHRQGYCHRDVKPSNLMIDAGGGCRVIDFGLAERTPAAGPPAGTPAYMAPEQHGGLADARSDVWGLGVTLYQMLTGELPFRQLGPALRAEVRTAPPRPPRAVTPAVPRDLQAICLKALAKSPDRRYQSAADMADDLRRWQTWRPTRARPGWWTLRPLRLWVWRNKGFTAALVLAAALVWAVTGWQMHSADQRAAAATERAELDRRQVEFRQLQDELATLRPNGRGRIAWSERWLSKVNEMQARQPGARLDDLRAVALTGLDATTQVRYSVPQRPDERRGFSSVAFSPNGKRVAAGGVRAIRERADGQQVGEYTPGMVWEGNAEQPSAQATEPGSGPVAFLDDDTPVQLLGAVRGQSAVRVWNLTTDRQVLDLPTKGRTQTAALAPHARFVAVSTHPDDKPYTVLWATDPTGATAPRVVGEWAESATALAFSADGRHLAVGMKDGRVAVHTTADGAKALDLPPVRLQVQSLAFGRTFSRREVGGKPGGGIPGLQLAVGTSGGLLQLHDLEADAPTHTVREFSHFLNALAFSPDGTRLVVAGHRSPLLIDVATGRVVFEFYRSGPPFGLRSYFTGVAFSPDGRRVAVSSFNQYGGVESGLDVFELDDARGVRTYHGLGGRVEKVWLSPSREWVAAVNQQFEVGVWHRASGRLRHVWQVPAGQWVDNTDLAFATDEKSFYFAGGGHITQYAVETGDRQDGWKVSDDGLNDNLFTKPDGSAWSLRREGWKANDSGRFVLRQLFPHSKAVQKYTQPAPSGPVHLAQVYAGGSHLVVTSGLGPHYRVALYDPDTGTPSAAPPTFPMKNLGGMFVTEGGRLLVANSREDRPERSKSFACRLADRATEELPHPGLVAHTLDDAGELFVTESVDPEVTFGVMLWRVGGTVPLVTFDLGERATTSRPNMLTGDGRFVYWGRGDGAVLVADVDRCLAALGKSRRK